MVLLSVRSGKKQLKPAKDVFADPTRFVFLFTVGLVAFKTKPEILDQYLQRAKAMVGMR